jgi:hypothetical protein
VLHKGPCCLSTGHIQRFGVYSSQGACSRNDMRQAAGSEMQAIKRSDGLSVLQCQSADCSVLHGSRQQAKLAALQQQQQVIHELWGAPCYPASSSCSVPALLSAWSQVFQSAAICCRWGWFACCSWLSTTMYCCGIKLRAVGRAQAAVLGVAVLHIVWCGRC